MRRIIENHIDEMLKILSDEAETKGLPPLTSKQVGLRFADKIECAKQLFPKIITPENYPNPFEQLYKLTSDALHNLSEGESCVLFDQCRHVFEYVFSKMRPHLKDRQKFLDDLQKLPTLASTTAATGARKN